MTNRRLEFNMANDRRKQWVKAYFRTHRHEKLTSKEIDDLMKRWSCLKSLKGEREHPVSHDDADIITLSQEEIMPILDKQR